MKATEIARFVVLALAVASASCGSVVRDGTGTSFLIIEELVAASGADPDTFVGVLQSDVLTIVDEHPTIFSDNGRVTFRLGLKDPGPAGSPTTPTQNQAITVDRYRVRFMRADGRNTPGVDVPYGFDGAFTATVSASTTASFELVRHVAKAEAPLGSLAKNFTTISTIAEITFYGRDLTGHEVSAVGRITVDFGNFADPDN
jgi:hypothetical protein